MGRVGCECISAVGKAYEKARGLQCARCAYGQSSPLWLKRGMKAEVSSSSSIKEAGILAEKLDLTSLT